MKKKLSLKNFKVSSFVTDSNEVNSETVKGGAPNSLWVCAVSRNCPHSYQDFCSRHGCDSIFYCEK